MRAAPANTKSNARALNPNPPSPPSVTAGYSGKRFVFEKAAELGVRAVVLDAADSWAQLLEPEGVIAKFVPVDFSDAESVLQQCLEVGGAVTAAAVVVFVCCFFCCRSFQWSCCGSGV